MDKSEKIYLFLKTNSEYFTNWLIDFTKKSPNVINLGEESIDISRAIDIPLPNIYDCHQLMIYGSLKVISDFENKKTLHETVPLFVFELIPLATDNNLKVTVWYRFPEGQDYLNALLKEIQKCWPEIKDQIKQVTGLTTTSDNSINVPIIDMRTRKQKVVEDACINWVNQPSPRSNMQDFLDNIEKDFGIFITQEQFKNALKDAGKHGKLIKVGRYWKPANGNIGT